MLVAIHQTHYLPWLRYFEKIARSDVFIVLDNIQFTKNGWQNRNKIKGPQGPLLLTVPVYAKHQQSLDEVRINNTEAWRKKHVRSIEQCYGASPYYATYGEAVCELYGRDWEGLAALNRAMLSYWVEALGIETPIVYASEVDAPGEATERLVNLIKAVGGDAYYSGAYALDAYLDAEALDRAGIALRLQSWRAPEYPQRFGDFVPDLSIADLLFNVGPDALATIVCAGEPGEEGI